jgi:Spy/CpxP family protein refolding chaperone
VSDYNEFDDTSDMTEEECRQMLRIVGNERDALREERNEARRELREATEAMDDPAINNLVTLPEAIRALVAAYRSGLDSGI